MRGKVIVRDGESIVQAIKRLRSKIAQDNASNRWPKWLGFHAKPSEKRHRKEWIRKMKLKWHKIKEKKDR